jgi:hypothetical protein
MAVQLAALVEAEDGLAIAYINGKKHGRGVYGNEFCCTLRPEYEKM